MAHAQSSVAPGEIHEHDEATAEVIDYDQDAPADSSEAPEGTFSHSHMSSPVFDLADPSVAARPGRIEGQAPPLVANTPALATLGWSPPVRPPRTA